MIDHDQSMASAGKDDSDDHRSSGSIPEFVRGPQANDNVYQVYATE